MALRSPKERRAHQRHSCDQAVVLMKDAVMADGVIRDLSAGGLYVSVRSDDFNVGDELTITLDATGGGKLKVKVVLARIRKDSFGHVTAMGLKIDDDAEVKSQWEAHVASSSVRD